MVWNISRIRSDYFVTEVIAEKYTLTYNIKSVNIHIIA